MKKGTDLREWVGLQYRPDPKLKRRVDELVTEMEIEQGLVALREERGVPRTALAKIIGPPRSGAVSGSTSSGSRAGGVDGRHTEGEAGEHHVIAREPSGAAPGLRPQHRDAARIVVDDTGLEPVTPGM